MADRFARAAPYFRMFRSFSGWFCYSLGVKLSPTPQRLSFTACLNQQAQPGFVARPVEEVVDQVSFGDALRLARPETDKVFSPARIHPAGDALLLNLTDKLPTDLARMTWTGVKRWVHHGSKTPEELRTPFVKGHQAPLDIEPLMETLQATMKEFPDLTPHLGAEHVWSKDALDYQGLGFWKRVGSALMGERPLPFPTLSRSKLICALGLGATSQVMPTGKEAKLKDWMLAQKPGSVELHGLFRESYKENEGDLYATLLCAENVLSEGLYQPDRGDREITSRLSYLRNDSAPQGDNFGAWYHLMGSALYSLMRPEWKANLSMKIEGVGSDILEGKDPQEDHINQLGVALGQRLRQCAENGLDEATAKPYLNLREFGWDRKNVKFFAPG